MLTHPEFDPVALYLGPFQLRWMGVMYLFAFGLFLVLGRYRGRVQPSVGLSDRQLDDLLTYGIVGVLLGGRLGYALIYQPTFYLANPLKVFSLMEGGMSFHGGLAGVLVATWFYARHHKTSWLQLTDAIAPLIPLGLGAGLLGYFINGELWGAPTALPWGVVFPTVDLLPRHPTQLYEALFQGVLLFALLWRYSQMPRPSGAVSGLFLVGYGVMDLVLEVTRGPEVIFGLISMGFNRSQWLSLLMVLIGFYLQQRASETEERKIALKAQSDATARGAERLQRLSGTRLFQEVMGITRKRVATGLVAFAVVSSGILLFNTLYARPQASGASQALLSASLPDLAGKSQPLSQWQGRVMVVNFWATWCPPCMKEIPAFVRMQSEYKNAGVTFVGIALDDPIAVKAMSRQYHINYPVLIGGSQGSELARRAGNAMNIVPYTVVLNQKGDIVLTHMGELNQARLRAIIEPLVNGDQK